MKTAQDIAFDGAVLRDKGTRERAIWLQGWKAAKVFSAVMHKRTLGKKTFSTQQIDAYKKKKPYITVFHCVTNKIQNFFLDLIASIALISKALLSPASAQLTLWHILLLFVRWILIDLNVHCDYCSFSCFFFFFTVFGAAAVQLSNLRSI